MKKQTTLFFFFIALLFYGCGLSTSRVKQGDEVPTEIKNEIDDLNIKVFQCLRSGDFVAFRNLLTDSLREKFRTKAGKESWNLFSTAAQNRTFEVHDLFYLKSLLPGRKVTLRTGDDVNEFECTVRPPTYETGVSLLIIRDHTLQFLLAVSYGKYNKKWLLNSIYMDKYAIFNKTAPDYYEKADDLYLNKYRIDALVTIGICNKVHPASDTFFRYTHQHTIDSFSESITAEVRKKYQLPCTLKNVTTKPIVLNVEPMLFRGMLMPCVTYFTNIKLSDSTSLKQENEDVQRSVNDLFYGFKRNNLYVYYRAYNEMPEKDKETASCDFMAYNKR